MQRRYYFPRLAATMLLSLSLFAACRQEDKAVQPDTAQVVKLAFLTETLDNENATEDDRKKAGEWMNGLTFGEMESLIDLRHQHYLKTGIVDAQRAAYLLDLRHTVNRKAFELKGKPFHQLDGNNLDEVILTVQGDKGSSKATGNPGARTTGSCDPTIKTPLCNAWRENGFIKVDGATGDKELLPGECKFLGTRTYQCSDGSYQKDCDYIYSYTYPKIYAPESVKFRIGLTVFSEGFSRRLTDNNPNRIDCDTYTMEIMFPKVRVDLILGNPTEAKQFFVLVLNVSIQTTWCYTGTWGTEKWYLYGGYTNNDGYGATNPNTGWYPCACTVDNYVVR